MKTIIMMITSEVMAVETACNKSKKKKVRMKEKSLKVK